MPPFHSLLWAVVTSVSFENHLHRRPICLQPPFISYVYFFVSRLPPTFHFPSEPWMGRSVSGLASLSFSHASAPELLGCETNLPTMGVLHCLDSLIDAGMLEVTHESESAFHASSDTPLKPLIVCAPGCEVQPLVVLWSCCPALQFLCTDSSSAVLKCWHYINLKENVKKKSKTHTDKPIRSVFVYTRVRTSIPK